MENNFSDFLSQNWNDKCKSASLDLQLQQSHHHQKHLFGQLLPISGNTNSSADLVDNHHGPTTTSISNRLTPTLSRSFLGEFNSPKILPQQNVDHKVSRMPTTYQPNLPTDHQTQMLMYHRPISTSDPSQSTHSQLSSHEASSKSRPRISNSKCNFPTTTSSSSSSTVDFQSMCNVNSRLNQQQPGHARDVVVDSTTPPPNVHSVSSGSGGVSTGSSLSAVLAAVVSSVSDPERKAANSIRGNLQLLIRYLAKGRRYAVLNIKQVIIVANNNRIFVDDFLYDIILIN